MATDKVIEYEGDGVTVIWKPGLCYHAKECVKGLPNVFRTKDRPWIDADQARANELMETIDKCPSGALSYINHSEGIDSSKKEKYTIEVTVLPNGPAIIDGSIKINNADGSMEEKDKVALCRCGASTNKPYCDGSHSKIDFKG